MRTAARRSPLPRLLVVAALAVVAGAGPWALPASAEDGAVEVRLDGYTPAEVTVQVGDTVTWTWATDGHSVTHEPDEGARAFDSHPDCTGFVRRFECGAQGEEFRHTFDAAGTYAYASRMDGNVRGTVVVEPAPTATPDPPSEPSSPSDEETTSEPTEAASGARDPEGSDDDAGGGASGTDADGGSDADTGADSGSRAPRSTSGRAPAQRFSSSGDGTGGAAPTPEVATADPTEATPSSAPSFAAFPEPTDPVTTPAEVAGEVAVGDDEGGGTARLLWGVLGGATVLGTAGAISRTVLFGDAWASRG